MKLFSVLPMAPKINSLYLTLLLLIFLPAPPTVTAGELRVTRLHFYFHDITTGPAPTSVLVTPRPVRFGSVVVMDDPLTDIPDIKTGKIVGRAQGTYAQASLSKTDPAVVMMMNFVLTAGEFAGSTVTVFGRNEALNPTREMPIIGGTGAFQLARGFVTLKTFFFNVTTGDAIVEYNATVLHH